MFIKKWAASTETYMPMGEFHNDLASLESEMKKECTEFVAPSMCYAYAALAEGVPFINGAPALTVDFTAMALLPMMEPNLNI